jgi:hypothetical protein
MQKISIKNSKSGDGNGLILSLKGSIPVPEEVIQPHSVELPLLSSEGIIMKENRRGTFI